MCSYYSTPSWTTFLINNGKMGIIDIFWQIISRSFLKKSLIHDSNGTNIIWSWFGIIFLVRKWFSLEALFHMPIPFEIPRGADWTPPINMCGGRSRKKYFIWDSLWVSIEAVILCSPVLFQYRHVKQSFKGKSFSNKENNSKPTPDNVYYDYTEQQTLTSCNKVHLTTLASAWDTAGI